MAGSSLFRHGDFVKLWVGQTISEAGTQVSFIALPLTAVIGLHATPFQAGLLGTFQFLPFLLVGLIAGVWADRLPRRRILITTDCVRAVALGSIPVVALAGTLAMPQLYVVAFITGTASVFFDVAYQSYLPALVPREALVDGNSKLEFTRATTEIAGPGLGGVLIGWLTAPVAVMVDAVSYVASVISLLLIRTPETPPPREDRQPIGVELREGLSFVLRHKTLRLIAASTATCNLFNHLGEAVLLIYAVRTIGLSPGQIGLWFAVGSLGAPVGAVIAPRLARRLGTGWTLIVSMFFCTAPCLVIPLAPKDIALPLFMLAGLAGSIGVAYNITQVSMRQAITPQRLQGRMNATMRTIVWGTIPIGSLAGGILGGTIGIHETLWVYAVGSLTATIPLLFAPVRTLRETPDAEIGDALEARIETDPLDVQGPV